MKKNSKSRSLWNVSMLRGYIFFGTNSNFPRSTRILENHGLEPRSSNLEIRDSLKSQIRLRIERTSFSACTVNQIEINQISITAEPSSFSIHNSSLVPPITPQELESHLFRVPVRSSLLAILLTQDLQIYIHFICTFWASNLKKLQWQARFFRIYFRHFIPLLFPIKFVAKIFFSWAAYFYLRKRGFDFFFEPIFSHLRLFLKRNRQK